MTGVVLGACSSGGGTASEPSSAPAPTAAKMADPGPLRDLEARYGARLGVVAVNTTTGRTIRYRSGEHFAICSVFKTYAVAALLRAHPLTTGFFDRRIHFTRGEVVANSPVTSTRVDLGMTVAELSEAAIAFSDNTAGNQLLKLLGGPHGVTLFARSIGDRATRLDRWEPDLNEAGRGDPRDTTTPAAIAAGYQALLLGNALPGPERARLTGWMLSTRTSTTRIRAGLPAGWRVADKTGAGRYATLNDVAVTWPAPNRPWVIAILSDQKTEAATSTDTLIADTAKAVVTALH